MTGGRVAPGESPLLDVSGVEQPTPGTVTSSAPGGQHALSGLRWVFMALPLWWVLGVEQFIWPVALTAVALTVTPLGHLVRRHAVFVWLGALTAAVLVSAAAIEATHRWLTFGRTAGAYVAALLLGAIILREATSRRDVEHLLSALLWVMGGAATLGLLSMVGVWRPAFTAPVSLLVPEWIQASPHGHAITTRSVGASGWFLGGDYFRVTSMFLWATTYATALVVAIPVAVYKFRQQSERASRLALMGLLVLLVVNLVGTTGRMAILGLAVGGGYSLWCLRFGRGRQDRRRARALAVVALATVGLVIVIIGPSRLVVIGSDVVGPALYARGSGTVDSRAAAYAEAFRGIQQKPVHGWGTERDFGGSISAGSHSYYIGVTFRHGTVALAAVIGLAVAWWRSTSTAALRGDLPFAIFARWAMIAVGVVALTSSIDLDTSTFLLVALVAWSAVRLSDVELPA